jgi:hypothetical protein
MIVQKTAAMPKHITAADVPESGTLLSKERLFAAPARR